MYLYRDSKKLASKILEPVAGYIMTAIILAFSASITYVASSFFNVTKQLPSIILASLFVLVSIVLFVGITFLFAFIMTVAKGKYLEFPQSEYLWEPRSIYKDGEIYEVPILLTVKNRSKYHEIQCSAYLKEFEIIYDNEFQEADEITKKLKSSNLINSKVTLLEWHERDLQSPECDMKILQQDERNIEIAWFQFLLKESSTDNNSVGRLRLQYHREEKLLKTQLGLYKFKVAIHCKRTDETETRIEYFEGYLYANISDEPSFEDDMRNKLKGKIVVGDGYWKKNKEIPKPVIRA